jgi:hypothetical protein
MELRKITLLVALLAMGLAAAAPAFAQANAVGGSVQYVDCDQIQAAATGQYNVGNQQDLAGIAQNLGVSQNQVSACLQSIAAGRNVNIKTPAPAAPTPKATAAPTPKATAAPTPKATAAPTPKATAAPTPKATATATASAPAALPPTGGAPVLALGAGALLLAGGLLARRIVR